MIALFATMHRIRLPPFFEGTVKVVAFCQIGKRLTVLFRKVFI
jgi:hypothetical protein